MGSAAARPRGRQQPRSWTGERDWILALLESTPDLTLRAPVAQRRERGVMDELWLSASPGSEYTAQLQKKTLSAAKQDRLCFGAMDRRRGVSHARFLPCRKRAMACAPAHSRSSRGSIFGEMAEVEMEWADE
jgi:hypothetical protein